MNFKHTLNCFGTSENIKKLKKELTNIGYGDSGSGDREPNFLGIGVSKGTGASIIKGGEFFAYRWNKSPLDNPNKREYIFNINNEWEYKAALAIASIVDDNKLHKGEWVKANNYWNYKEGDVTYITFADNFDGLWKIMTPELDAAYPKKEGFAYNESFTKLSPEEIIEHFKPKEMKEEFKLPEKWHVRWRNKETFNASNQHWRTPKTQWYFVDDSCVDQDGVYYSGIGGVPKMHGSTELTLEQFKKYVLKQNNMEKQIVGYLIKEEKYRKFAEVLGGEGDKLIEWACNGETVSMSADSRMKKACEEAGTLDVWFTPVYKTERKSVKISIGQPVKQATVENGIIRMEDGREFEEKHVKALNNLIDSSIDVVGGHDVYVKNVWIGCSSEGTGITRRDVDILLDALKRTK